MVARTGVDGVMVARGRLNVYYYWGPGLGWLGGVLPSSTLGLVLLVGSFAKHTHDFIFSYFLYYTP